MLLAVPCGPVTHHTCCMQSSCSGAYCCGSSAYGDGGHTMHKLVMGLRDLYVVGDRWAMTQLGASGEDVVGRIRCPQYLLLARTLLLGRTGTGLPWKWWALRTLAVQQRILSGPAAALQTDTERLTEEVWPLQRH